MRSAVEIWVGKTLEVGKQPTLSLYLRLAPMWQEACGWRDGDFDTPDGVEPVRSGEMDGHLLNAVALTIVAQCLPHVFPDAVKVRDHKVLEIHDIVQDQLIEQGLSVEEIGAVVKAGIDVYQALQAQFFALQAARKEAKGNSEAPKGGSSTGTT